MCSKYNLWVQYLVYTIRGDYIIVYVRYVGAILSTFHVLHLLPIGFYTTKVMLHLQTHDEMFANIGPPLIYLRSLEVHVCWFLKWIQRSSQLCSIVSVE